MVQIQVSGGVVTSTEWMKLGEVAALLKCDIRTVLRWVRQNKFPQPSRLSKRFVRWRREAVESFMKAQELPTPA